MIVATLYRPGPEFNAEHVNRLRKQVKRYMPDARFVCLSNATNVPCERIPLVHGWTRWWGQLELFRPGLFDGPVLYMDLDTTLLGPVEIPVQEGEFWSLKCPRTGKPTSGVMCWWGDFSHIYHANAGTKHFRYHDWVNDGIFPHVAPILIQDRLPGFYSYKAHKIAKRVPADARLIYFHGKPRPWDVPEVTLGAA